MSGLIKRAYMITLNGVNTIVIFSSGAYAGMIMDDMRNDHFEDIFGVEITPATKSLEEQYEIEYKWDYVEIQYITPADAEARYNKIMKQATEEL